MEPTNRLWIEHSDMFHFTDVRSSANISRSFLSRPFQSNRSSMNGWSFSIFHDGWGCDIETLVRLMSRESMDFVDGTPLERSRRCDDHCKSPVRCWCDVVSLRVNDESFSLGHVFPVLQLEIDRCLMSCSVSSKATSDVVEKILEKWSNSLRTHPHRHVSLDRLTGDHTDHWCIDLGWSNSLNYQDKTELTSFGYEWHGEWRVRTSRGESRAEHILTRVMENLEIWKATNVTLNRPLSEIKRRHSAQHDRLPSSSDTFMWVWLSLWIFRLSLENMISAERRAVELVA